MLNKSFKSANGFTFLETMIALFVLVVCLASLAPTLDRVSSERLAIIEKENALSLLNNQLTVWSAGNANLPAELNQNHILYNLEWRTLDQHTIQLCITWKNKAERNQVVCGKAKH
jgi:Tfp pilus assembly protein PilV